MEDVSTYKQLGEYLGKSNITEAAILIYELFKRDGNNFIRNVLLEGILPEPLEMDFKDNEAILGEFHNAVMSAMGICQENDKEPLFRTCTDLILSINIISSLNDSNNGELYKDGLFDIPVKQMIHMLCVFLENQNRFTDIELTQKLGKNGYIDMMQSDVADITVDSGSNISLTDNIEAGIEIAKSLIAYLFYMGRKEMDNEYVRPVDVSPYNLPNINKISKLGLHRQTLDLIWEKVKYQNWRPKAFSQSGEIIRYFQPQNKNDFRLARAAIERGIYKDRIEIFNNLSKESINEELLFVYNTTKEVSKSIDLFNVDTLFEINKEVYVECINHQWNQNSIHIKDLSYISDKFLESNYFGRNKSINFIMYLNFVYYLQILGKIYSGRSHHNFEVNNRENYRFLAPVVAREKLISHFISLYEYDEEVVTELVDLLTYKPKPKSKKVKYLGDLFSQPMVYVGVNDLILVPAITEQLNIARMIEQQISLWEIKVSKKGFGFEDEIIKMLQLCPLLNVNVNKIKFEAYDGESVEFDFIGTFEDKILLIEMKCIRKQYSPKEYYLREKDVLYGVEQVNRRVKVLMEDWEEIRKRASIKLPPNPPAENDIIKLVCLNVLDFTGRQIDGVSIIDESMLLKYFLSGETQAKSISIKGSSVLQTKSIWSKGYPTVEELLAFVKMPVAVQGFYESLEEQRRWLMLVKESDFKIGFCDFVLFKNPFEYDLMKLNALDGKKSKRVKYRSNKKKIAKQKKLSKKKQRGR